MLLDRLAGAFSAFERVLAKHLHLPFFDVVLQQAVAKRSISAVIETLVQKRNRYVSIFERADWLVVTEVGVTVLYFLRWQLFSQHWSDTD